MLMENQASTIKFCGPLNIYSQQNSIAAFCYTTEVEGDL